MKSIEHMEKSNYLTMFQYAKKSGCKFTFGSDSHQTIGHSTWGKAYVAAELLDLKASDILVL